MQNQFGAWYGYAVGSARFPWQDGTYAWYGTQTNETPLINHSDPHAHSLSQLWGIDDSLGPTAFSDAEIGWNIDPGVNGDYHAHLFTFMFDDGIPGCYDELCPNGSRGYFYPSSTSVFPGMLVQSSDGSIHTYGIQEYGDGWWLYYDGTWFGGFPAASYPSYHPLAYLRLDAGGEVAGSTSTACSDMGNGRFPSTHASARWASTWRGYTAGFTTVNLTNTDSDPSAWNSAFYNTTGGFLYGGSGYAGC